MFEGTFNKQRLTPACVFWTVSTVHLKTKRDPVVSTLWQNRPKAMDYGESNSQGYCNISSLECFRVYQSTCCVCEIWGSHSSVVADSSLLGCYSLSTTYLNLVPSNSASNSP